MGALDGPWSGSREAGLLSRDCMVYITSSCQAGWGKVKIGYVELGL